MLWVVCVAWQEGMRARDGRVRIVERVDDVVRRAGAAWRPRQGIQVVTAARMKFRLIITCAGSCRSCLFIIDGEAAVAVLPTAT